MAYSPAQDDTRRRKVLVFGSFAPPSVPCGITTAVHNFVQSPIRTRYDLTVVSTFRGGGGKRERNVVRRLAYGLYLGFIATLRIVISGAHLVDVHVVSSRDFLKHGAVLMAAKLAARPSVLRIHGGDFDCVFANSGALGRAIIRWILRLPDRVVLLSRSWAEKLKRIEPRTKSCVVPNPIDCREFCEVAGERPASANSVLLLGNLCERKGHFDALEAAAIVLASHPDVDFLFAGAERDKGALKQLERRAQELQIKANIRFLGPVFGEAKDAAFATAGILILPSHTENMPLSIMEGMAAGLPVIASKVGAVPEMIEDGVTGFLFESRDCPALAARIAALLEDPDLRREMGARARRAAEQLWDTEVVAAINEELYNAVSASSADRRL